MTLGPRCRFQQSSAVGFNLKWKISSVSRPCELLQVQQSRPVVSNAPSCASQHSVFFLYIRQTKGWTNRIDEAQETIKRLVKLKQWFLSRDKARHGMKLTRGSLF